MTPRLAFLQGAAIAASLFHVLIDAWLGLFGRGQMTVGQALMLMSLAAIYGWWPAATAAAATGRRGAMLALAILAGVWAFLGQGLAGLAFCFVPCGGVPPWGDVSHLASLVFGGWAAMEAWRAYRAMPGPTQVAFPVTAVVLIVLAFALGAAYAVVPAS